MKTQRIAFIGSLVGLVILYFLSTHLDYEESDLDTLDEMIKARGTIISSSNLGNITIISLAQQKDLQVVVFDSLSYQSGQEIEIIGSVGTYKGEKQIVAHRIRAIP